LRPRIVARRKVAGVINFVGGWMAEGCPNAREVNGTLFKRGGTFPHPTLWLYGNHDPFYSLDHSRANFAAFHRVMFSPPLWTDHVDRYLDSIATGAKQ